MNRTTPITPITLTTKSMTQTCVTSGLLTVAALATLCAAQSQPLYSNGSPNVSEPALALSTSSISGVTAPANSFYSEAAGTASDVNIYTGFSAYRDASDPFGTYRVADDFNVTQENGWTLDSITLYVYVPGYTGTASPFASANVRLWQGAPGSPQPSLLWGDATTNRLLSAARTNYYRIFNTRSLPGPNPVTPPSTQRRLWEVNISLGGNTLPLGNYHFDVQLACTNPSHQAFIVPATQSGSRSATIPLSEPNALIFAPNVLSSAWTPLTDPGKPFLAPDQPQDIAFILTGTEQLYPCPADFNQDGGIDGSDVGTFFEAWSAADPSTDVNYDGGIDGSDVATFFDAWSNGGC
jgi:hypothetical protein